MAFTATDAVLAVATVALFVISITKREIIPVLNQVAGEISPWWALIPIIFLIIYRLLRVNYNNFQVLQQATTQQLQKIALLEDRLTPKIQIVFGTGAPYESTRSFENVTEIERLFRVEVENTSGITVHGVTLKLGPIHRIDVELFKDIRYTPITNYPERELQQENDHNYPASRKVEALPPKSNEAFRVVRKREPEGKDTGHELILCYADNPEKIPGARYEFTLSAYCEEGPSCIRTFMASIDDAGRLFFELFTRST